MTLRGDRGTFGSALLFVQSIVRWGGVRDAWNNRGVSPVALLRVAQVKSREASPKAWKAPRCASWLIRQQGLVSWECLGWLNFVSAPFCMRTIGMETAVSLPGASLLKVRNTECVWIVRWVWHGWWGSFWADGDQFGLSGGSRLVVSNVNTKYKLFLCERQTPTGSTYWAYAIQGHTHCRLAAVLPGSGVECSKNVPNCKLGFSLRLSSDHYLYSVIPRIFFPRTLKRRFWSRKCVSPDCSASAQRTGFSFRTGRDRYTPGG